LAFVEPVAVGIRFWYWFCCSCMHVDGLMPLFFIIVVVSGVAYAARFVL